MIKESIWKIKYTYDTLPEVQFTVLHASSRWLDLFYWGDH